ncbi:MAG: TonB-dependent receptor, partial [Deltaproteobacteria bacterium]|nr:TonB-dependent receptor [Deltaproteobacteria bacterium]
TVSEYGDSLSNERPLGPGTLTLGLGYRGISADSSEFGKHSESSFHFLAAQSVETPSFPLTLKAGIRANLNSAFENTFNPEFSVGYGNPKFRALYKISLGANLPSFQQRFGRSASTDPNPGLGPEKGLNQSLGLDWFPFDFLTLNLTLFHNRLKGRISYVRPVDSGIGRYENLGSTVYQGFDAGFVAKIGKPVELKVGYTFLDARDKDIGKFLTSRPRHSVLAELTFRAGDTFSLTLKADGESKSYTDRMNTATLAPRTLFGLRAEKSFGNLVIFFDGTNIFDKEYYYVDGLLAPPRVFHLGTKYNFQ